MSERYSILDFSAVINHCLHAGKDENEIPLGDGKYCNSANHSITVFLEEYLIPILADCPPRYLLVAHDAGTAYREFIAPDYKAKRKLHAAQNIDGIRHAEFEKVSRGVKQILASIGATQLKVEGVEADDVIAYLCRGIPHQKRVYTVDADLMALVDNSTQVYLKNCWINPMAPDEEYGTAFVHFMFEVLGNKFPRYVTLAKALIGDTSDEFKGVSNFGRGCFKIMFSDIGFDGLEEIIHAVEQKDFTAIKEAAGCYEKLPRWLKLLSENLPEFRKGWALASLHPELCEEPFQKKLPVIEWYKRVPCEAKLNAVLKFTNNLHVLPEFEDYFPKTFVVTSKNFSPELLDEFESAMKKSPTIAFDYEAWDDHYENFKQASTTGKHVDAPHSRISGISFSYGEHWQHNFYLTVDHKDSDNLPAESILEFFARIPKESVLIAHYSVFELTVTLAQLNHTLENVHDTQLMARYCNENELQSGLKHLSKQYLNYDQTSYADTIAQAGIIDASMRDLTLKQVTKYGVDDSIVTGCLYDLFKLRMMLENTWDFYKTYEPDTNTVLAQAHAKGVKIDWKKLAEIEASDRKAVEKNMARLREILEEHCTELVQANVDHYLSVEERVWQLEAQAKFSDMTEAKLDKALAAHDSVSTEGSKVGRLVAAALRDKKQQIESGGVYKEFREVKVLKEFVPTVTNLNRIATHVGFSGLLEKVTNTAIREWLRANAPFSLDELAPTLTAEQTQFHKLLAAANGALKSRCGDAYDKFIAFCKANDPAPAALMKVGTELNLNSPKQSQLLLYVMLGAKVVNHTKPQVKSFRQRNKLQGSPATDETAVSTAIAEDFEDGSWQIEALRCLLAAKSAQTRIGLYHTPYKLWRHPDDDLIYPTLRNFGTVTGRPSGSAPNILQVSKHQEEGVMRSVYLPRHDDHCIVAIDFAGQELRILASRSEDRNMLSAYIGAKNAETYLKDKQQGKLSQWSKEEVEKLDDLKDIHSQSAAGMSSIFGLPKMTYEEFVEALGDSDHIHHKGAGKIRKRPAKTTNFLMSYGGTAPALAQKLIIKLATAEKMMTATDKVYPNIAKWQESSAAFARKHGYTLTAYGKRRHASNDIFSKSGALRSRVERQVANAEIQGTAADILKVVLSESWKQKLWQSTGAVMIAPVYDEIVASVPHDKVVEYITRLAAIMNLTPPNMPVPMVADISIGHNWQAQIELGSSPTNDEIIAAVSTVKELGDDHGKS